MKQIHQEILAAQQSVYSPCGLHFTEALPEAESEDYGAHTFELENYVIKFRVAKVTAKKIGQFVTCWKRIKNGPIQPFDLEDPFHFLVVNVRTKEHFGQFVFPKAILLQKGVVARAGKGGKRAIRVYPPWDQPASPQAQKTQNWQLTYFLEVPHRNAMDRERVQSLYLLSR